MPVKNKLCSYMSYMALPAVRKIGGLATSIMCKSIVVYTSKTGQYAVLCHGTI